MLREELQLLQEPGSYVGEVVKVMSKTKVLVKARATPARCGCAGRRIWPAAVRALCSCAYWPRPPAVRRLRGARSGVP